MLFRSVEFYNNCDYYNITLNFKTKKVFNNYGIRIGTQEISRYDWGDSELLILAEILKCLYEYPKAYLNNEIDTYVNNKIKLLLPLKKIRFTFDESAYKPILENLLF